MASEKKVDLKKYAKLGKYFPVWKAAEHLSDSQHMEYIEADLLQAGLDGTLTLSVKLKVTARTTASTSLRSNLS